MATSYTVFLSDDAVPPRRRRKLMGGEGDDRDSEPKEELQLAGGREHKMLFDSSTVIATKGCE